MSLCKQTDEIGLCNPKGIFAMCFLLRNGLFVSQGAGEREKRKRAENDGHAFGAGAHAEKRARHVISRRVETNTTCDYSVLNFLPRVT